MSYRDPENWKLEQADERHRAQADWADPAKVRESRDLVLSSPIRQLTLGRCLAGLVDRHAPQNLSILPPVWREETPDAA